MPTFLKYWLIQLPGAACLAAALFWANSSGWISARSGLALFLAWVAFDAAFYPLTRDAYRGGEARHGPQAGHPGVVRKPLQPSGTVLVSGTLWNAKLEEPDQVAEPGEPVRVVECRGLLLIVARQTPGTTA